MIVRLFLRSSFWWIAVALITVYAGCTYEPVDTLAVRNEDLRVELVDWARLAQSAHNYQPWRVVLDPDRSDRMWLYIETERLLPETDPPARQITISAGTFLAVLEARAAQLGLATQIELFPHGQYDLETIGTLPVAAVVLNEFSGATSSLAIAADVDALTQATVKYRYRPAELDASFRRRLTTWSDWDSGIQVSVLTDPADVQWLNEISRQAYVIEMRNPATRAETYESTRMTRRARRQQPYGLAYTANFRPVILRVVETSQILFPQSHEKWAETGIDQFTAALDDINTYIVITSETNDRTAQVQTGRMLQALWMEIQAAGHVVLANSQALQEYPKVRELYTKVHERLAPDGETVQMILAVARPATGRHLHSPRFRAEALISSPD